MILQKIIYTEMKKVLSEPFSQYDISNGVYGMKSATLSGIEYIEESSDWSTDTLIFNCTFDNPFCIRNGL